MGNASNFRIQGPCQSFQSLTEEQQRSVAAAIADFDAE
jgi:hypothetical protein